MLLSLRDEIDLGRRVSAALIKSNRRRPPCGELPGGAPRQASRCEHLTATASRLAAVLRAPSPAFDLSLALFAKKQQRLDAAARRPAAMRRMGSCSRLAAALRATPSPRYDVRNARPANGELGLARCASPSYRASLLGARPANK
jgi:hypothetical protein